MDGQQRKHQGPARDPAPPTLLFCHLPFGKDLDGIREYAASHRYAGVEWSLDGWRMMVARSRRQKMTEGLQQSASLCSLHAPYTDLEIGHRDATYAAAAVRALQQYIDAAVELGAHHVNLHVGSFAPEPEELSWDTLVRSLATLMEYAARHGMNPVGGGLPGSYSTCGRRASASFTFSSGYS